MNFGTNLLKKLLRSDANKYNRLVLNFYSSEKGYSIGFNIQDVSSDTNNNLKSSNINSSISSFGGNNGKEVSSPPSLNSVETDLLSYNETELLFYINAGEIPPILIDLVDRLSVRRLS